MSSLHICPREKFPNFRAEMKELLKILTEKRKVAKIDKSKMTAGQKAAYTRKWRGAQQKALLTAKNAKTFARYKLSQEGYRCISFDSSKGYEYKGVVDLVAVKRDTRNAGRQSFDSFLGSSSLTSITTEPFGAFGATEGSLIKKRGPSLKVHSPKGT